MAFNVVFYSGFSKKLNSTAQPSGSGTTHSCELKDSCSVLYPEILVHRLTADASPHTYNYCYIQKFGRYYWVKDWSWEKGVWRASLAVDVLASWKTQIGNTTAYIERAVTEYNGDIQDKLYPATTNSTITAVSMTSGYVNITPANGCFVLGIINNANFAESQPGGAVTYYAMTPTQMRSLMHYLLSDTFLDDNGFPQTMGTGQQLAHDTAKAFVNPIQYITSCMWFPVPANDISDGVDVNIVLGYFDLDANVVVGKKVNSFAYIDHVAGIIPYHPQAQSRGGYLNYAPYTRISISVPPFGLIPIDTSFLRIGNYVYCKLLVDVITGKANLRVTIQRDLEHLDNDTIVTEANSVFGIPIPLSQMIPDYLGVVSGAGSLISNIASGYSSGGISGAVTNAFMSLNSVGDSVSSLMAQPQVQGVSGSFMQNIAHPIMTVQHFNVADENLTDCGRPLCRTKTINTLSGFIKCGDVADTIPATEDEKTSITGHMLNGFYYE